MIERVKMGEFANDEPSNFEAHQPCYLGEVVLYLVA